MKNIKPLDSLKQIVNERFDMFGEKTAFIEKFDGDKEFSNISYNRVKNEINSLGSVMIKKLNLKDKKIAVIGQNSYKWYVTYMAVACGVGIIVPLDKELPENEILNLLNRSDAKCLVYSSRKKDIIEKIKDKLPKDFVYIEMGKESFDEFSYSYDELVGEGKKIIDNGYNEYIDMKINRDEFRILLFTSGTTSAPKGVMLSHKNLCANIFSAYNLIEDIGECTYFSVLPIHHTYEFSLTYLFGTSEGATIGICQGLKYVAKDLKVIRPTIFLAVPALIEKLSEKIDKEIEKTGKAKLISVIGNISYGLSRVGIDFRKVIFKKIHETFGGRLKYLLSGAAPIDAKLEKKFEIYGIRFLQGYGITEASPLICATTKKNYDFGTCGNEIVGEEVKIDLSKNDDKTSNIGEILAKGDNIMIGYYQDDEKTKETIKDGWLYTGDLGYFNKNGNLVITGRSKNVIVTANGKNIYPEELETLINRIPLVNESMVYGKEDEKDKLELIVTARVTLNEEYIESTYGKNRPSDSKIYDMIWNEIKNINKGLVSYKVIKSLEIKKEDFVKTTTMKIKRFEEVKNAEKNK